MNYLFLLALMPTEADVARFVNELFFELGKNECATIALAEVPPAWQLIVCKERYPHGYHLAVWYGLENGKVYFDKNY